MNDHDKKHLAEAGIGAFSELATRGGSNLTRHIHHHGAAKAGQSMVKGAAYVAPVAVAAAATASAALSPVVVAAGIGWGLYEVGKWIYKRC